VEGLGHLVGGDRNEWYNLTPAAKKHAAEAGSSVTLPD
jgi:hypothetical protein